MLEIIAANSQKNKKIFESGVHGWFFSRVLQQDNQ